MQAKMNENNLPWWVFIVFLVLGWDEVVNVLTNPLLLLMTIAGIGTCHPSFLLFFVSPFLNLSLTDEQVFLLSSSHYQPTF
jgi:hypothetical protein